MKSRRTRKQRGGEGIPLITYTPHYREVEFTHEGIGTYFDSNYQKEAKCINIKIPLNKYKFDMRYLGTTVNMDPINVKICFYSRSSPDTNVTIEEVRKFQEEFSIVFAAFVIYHHYSFSIPGQTSGSSSYSPSIYFIDNKGNIYSGGTYEKNFYGQFDNKKIITAIQYKNTKILPDSMIDSVIDKSITLFDESYKISQLNGQPYKKYTICEQFRHDSKTYFVIPPKEPQVQPIPHRSLEPSAELAEYIASLEAAVAKPNNTAKAKEWASPSLKKLANNLAKTNAINASIPNIMNNNTPTKPFATPGLAKMLGPKTRKANRRN